MEQCSLFPTDCRCYERENYAAAFGAATINHCGNSYQSGGVDYCRLNGKLADYVGFCANRKED